MDLCINKNNKSSCYSNKKIYNKTTDKNLLDEVHCDWADRKVLVHRLAGIYPAIIYLVKNSVKIVKV